MGKKMDKKEKKIDLNLIYYYNYFFIDKIIKTY